MEIVSWNVQLRKGAAELAVLSVLARTEAYGLQILELANTAGEIVTEGALYPLLARLEKEGKLNSRWVTDDGPHPRKFYRVTEQGAAAHDEMVKAWVVFRMAMSQVVEDDQWRNSRGVATQSRSISSDLPHPSGQSPSQSVSRSSPRSRATSPSG